MREYGRIAPTFWTRGTGKSLRGDHVAQLVALYLMSAPGANMAGLFYVPLVQIAHEIGAPLEEVEAAIARLHEGPPQGPSQGPYEGVRNGFLVYSEGAETVFVRTMARRQLGLDDGERLKEGDNRCKHVVRLMKECSDPLILQAFWEEYRETFHLPDPWWNKALTKVLGKPLRSQAQAQAQAQTSGGDVADAPGPADAEAPTEVVDSEPEQPPDSKPRPAAAKQQALKPTEQVALGWERWTKLYASSRRRYGQYSRAPEDGKVMKRVTEHARSLGLEELRLRNEPQTDLEMVVRELLDHWFKAYLRDDGDRDFLSTHRHGLKWLPQDIPKYGTPWSRDRTIDPADVEAAKADFEATRDEAVDATRCA